MPVASKKRVLNVGALGEAHSLPAHYKSWDVLVGNRVAVTKPDLEVDLRTLTSRPSGEFDAIYCSHVLQTLYAHEVGSALEGMHHVASADGFVEIRVPDIAAVMRVATEKKLGVDGILYTSPAGPISVRDALYGYARNVRAAPEQFAHHVAFSREALRALLGRAGFAAAALLRPRALEIAVVAFPNAPSDELRTLLKLKG